MSLDEFAQEVSERSGLDPKDAYELSRTILRYLVTSDTIDDLIRIAQRFQTVKE